MFVSTIGTKFPVLNFVEFHKYFAKLCHIRNKFRDISNPPSTYVRCCYMACNLPCFNAVFFQLYTVCFNDPYFNGIYDSRAVTFNAHMFHYIFLFMREGSRLKNYVSSLGEACFMILRCLHARRTLSLCSALRLCLSYGLTLMSLYNCIVYC
jgi:hypothetical protein